MLLELTFLLACLDFVLLLVSGFLLFAVGRVDGKMKGKGRHQ